MSDKNIALGAISRYCSYYDLEINAAPLPTGKAVRD
jgi:hypothetical protein